MKLRNAGILLSFFVASVSVAGTESGAGTSPLVTIARQFLAAELPAASKDSEREIRVTEPDPRLQLAACASAPLAFWPANARQTGNTVVGVRCPDANGWQVFLPVQIQEWSTVLVASRPLRPGERLQADDIKPMRVSRDQLRGDTVQDPKALLGTLTRQAIAAGQPLTRQLTCQICRGDEVRIAAGQPGFEVIMKGIAQGAGNIGDRVSVRNLSSRRTVQAEVVGTGLVRVNL